MAVAFHHGHSLRTPPEGHLLLSEFHPRPGRGPQSASQIQWKLERLPGIFKNFRTGERHTERKEQYFKKIISPKVLSGLKRSSGSNAAAVVKHPGADVVERRGK